MTDDIHLCAAVLAALADSVTSVEGGVPKSEPASAHLAPPPVTEGKKKYTRSLLFPPAFRFAVVAFSLRWLAAKCNRLPTAVFVLAAVQSFRPRLLVSCGGASEPNGGLN